jgi:putative holliday junction resolvase
MTERHDSSGWPTGTGKLLALDVGLARIGLAVCDPLRLGARPLNVLHRTSRNADFEALAKTVVAQEIVGIVCGLPLNMDGSEGDQARTTRKWAMRLAQAVRVLVGKPVPLAFWDERMSTFTAQEVMAERGLKVGEDAAAAAVILQDFLDAARKGELPTDLIVLPPKGAGGEESFHEDESV